MQANGRLSRVLGEAEDAANLGQPLPGTRRAGRQHEGACLQRQAERGLLQDQLRTMLTNSTFSK